MVWESDPKHRIKMTLEWDRNMEWECDLDGGLGIRPGTWTLNFLAHSETWSGIQNC